MGPHYLVRRVLRATPPLRTFGISKACGMCIPHITEHTRGACIGWSFLITWCMPFCCRDRDVTAHTRAHVGGHRRHHHHIHTRKHTYTLTHTTRSLSVQRQTAFNKLRVIFQANCLVSLASTTLLKRRYTVNTRRGSYKALFIRDHKGRGVMLPLGTPSGQRRRHEDDAEASTKQQSSCGPQQQPRTPNPRFAC